MGRDVFGSERMGSLLCGDYFIRGSDPQSMVSPMMFVTIEMMINQLVLWECLHGRVCTAVAQGEGLHSVSFSAKTSSMTTTCAMSSSGGRRLRSCTRAMPPRFASLDSPAGDRLWHGRVGPATVSLETMADMQMASFKRGGYADGVFQARFSTRRRAGDCVAGEQAHSGYRSLGPQLSLPRVGCVRDRTHYGVVVIRLLLARCAGVSRLRAERPRTRGIKWGRRMGPTGPRARKRSVFSSRVCLSNF